MCGDRRWWDDRRGLRAQLGTARHQHVYQCDICADHGSEGEGLPAGTYRRIVITTKQHRADDGPDTSGDVDIKWVKFIQCYDGPTGAVAHEDVWPIVERGPRHSLDRGVPEWATTQPCVDCAPQCATCIFVALFDYYSGLGWRRWWAIGTSRSGPIRHHSRRR